MNQTRQKSKFLKENEFRILDQNLTKFLMKSVTHSRCDIRTIEKILSNQMFNLSCKFILPFSS